MKAIAVEPDPAAGAALAAVSFADAYRTTTATPGLCARQAAEAVFASPPAWINALMAVRNHVMGWFGVKTSAAQFAPTATARVGMFPVVSDSPRHILLGFDDRHLDFRITVSLRDAPEGRTAVTVTTAVLTHNLLGRCYLAAILPFHRRIARYMLSQARFA
ncbi:MAG: DUF2867 domain-containing protein [Pseudomonadota bacterium]